MEVVGYVPCPVWIGKHAHWWSGSDSVCYVYVTLGMALGGMPLCPIHAQKSRMAKAPYRFHM